jgi:hypothetical protein
MDWHCVRQHCKAVHGNDHLDSDSCPDQQID